MKFTFICILSLLISGSVIRAFGQTYPDCDLVKVTGVTNFCIEYLSFKWLKVTKEKANYFRYVFFEKRKLSKMYPWEYYAGEKLTKNDVLVSNLDTLQLLNGIYRWKDKKGRLTQEYLYENGKLLKHINWDKSIFKRKLRGKIVSEIAEYDYSYFPFRLRYMSFKNNGDIKENLLMHQKDGIWIGELAEDKLYPAMPINVLPD